MIVAASLVVLVVQLDFFAVQTALPDVAREPGTSATDLQWLISGYLLATGSLLGVGGRIGDILGRRRWLFVGAAAFGPASLAGGLASTASVGSPRSSVGVEVGRRSLRGRPGC